MHYHYFTLEQRGSLEAVIRDRLSGAGMHYALERLRSPEFGVCESCGADIPYVRLADDPLLNRCPACQPKA